MTRPSVSLDDQNRSQALILSKGQFLDEHTMLILMLSLSSAMLLFLLLTIFSLQVLFSVSNVLDSVCTNRPKKKYMFD